MYYRKFKREKAGSCNLCGKTDTLTWDHVPPRAGKYTDEVEIRSIVRYASVKGGTACIYSQNGVKFRTLCEECNHLLGTRYDPHLIGFTSDVGSALKSNSQLPFEICVKAEPDGILRSVLGHLVSAKVLRDAGSLDESVRPFIFDPSQDVPDHIHVFYWLYPYHYKVILRDVALPSRRGDFTSWMYCHLLKYWPVAFLVTDANEYENLPELTRFRECQPGHVEDIYLTQTHIYAPDWPEQSNRGNILIGGRALTHSVVSKPRGGRNDTGRR